MALANVNFAAVNNTNDTGPMRSVMFWTRATGIYLSYKFTQAQAAALRLTGSAEDDIQKRLWLPHNDRTGRAMHDLCVDMRGFLIKAGQFVGARNDLMPEEVCVWLRRLQDQVPPMPPQQTEAVLKAELGVDNLDHVFDWIDLQAPLGAASIAQVHKAQLRRLQQPPRRKPFLLRVAARVGRFILRRPVRINASTTLPPINPAIIASQGDDGRISSALDAAGGDVVAVKVQYPDALPLFEQDLKNLRGLAGFLSRTEVKFDLVSAVDELSGQVKMEFDFNREARVLDTTADHLQSMHKRVVIPRSVPGLVTQRVLVMSFLPGVPLTQLGNHTSGLSDFEKKAAFKRIIGHASEAYGRMILETGLFQADAHPGNLLVMEGGKVGIIDFGQCKQLQEHDRLLIARLILAFNQGDDRLISDVMTEMGIVTELSEHGIRAKMGRDMFDTSGHINAFGEGSNLKKNPITDFPKHFFLVLRVVQLFRGMTTRMDIDFSTAEQWKPFAEAALNGGPKQPRSEPVPEPAGKYYGI